MWQDVKGWQTTVTINEKGVAVVQWAVDERYGQGLMRWILYGSKGKSVIGVSPTSSFADRRRRQLCHEPQ